MGYIYLNKPYVVPITYFFDKEENSIICYSGEGHKLNAMRKHTAVSLLVEEIESIGNWESVLVHGVFEQHINNTILNILSITTPIIQILELGPS